MRLKLISCEIFFREVCHLLARTPHTVDLQFLPKGLHDLGAEKMVHRLQEQIDAVPADAYDAVLLGYALCNNGVVGLRAADVPLVLPRGHDCITLFLGSRQSYREYFDAHPGTYYRTTGWYERADAASADDVTVPQQLGLFQSYEELVRQYGEDNARYIIETMGDPTVNYDCIGFIRMRLVAEEPFRRQAVAEADERGWTFKELDGSLELLRKLVDAEWDEDFLVVSPGEVVAATHDENIFTALPAACAPAQTAASDARAADSAGGCQDVGS